MRRITLWLLSTLSALVLLFSYHTSRGVATAATSAHGSPTTGTGAGADPASGSGTGTTTSAGSGATAGSGTSAGSTTGSTSKSGASTAATTVVGDMIDTQYGPVQVQITVAGGKITKSAVLQVPWNNGHDMQINSYAVPVLNREAVAAQSANIDMVSGATYTSDGYIQSLQSAIDQAHL